MARVLIAAVLLLAGCAEPQVIFDPPRVYTGQLLIDGELVARDAEVLLVRTGRPWLRIDGCTVPLRSVSPDGFQFTDDPLDCETGVVEWAVVGRFSSNGRWIHSTVIMSDRELRFIGWQQGWTP